MSAPVTRRLDTLLEPGDCPAELAALTISGLSLDSRLIKRGDVFCALQGTAEHGLSFAEAAIANGAALILSDGEVAGASFSVPVLTVTGLRTKLGSIASKFYDQPSQQLAVLAVTGTNGKTSVAYYLAQMLHESHVCGFVGTVGVGSVNTLREQARTTPDVISVHRSLNDFVAQGARAVAMEVSSHALDQGRVNGVRVKVAAFTNLSRDHLDYHGDMAAYAAAKKSLFTDYGAEHAVISLDDQTGENWLADIPPSTSVLTYSVDTKRTDADLQVTSLGLDARGVRMTVTTPVGKLSLQSTLIGDFNVSNVLAAVAVMICCGVEAEQIVRAVKALRSAPGRMDAFGGDELPLVVVDYAHTPDALEKVLLVLQRHCRGKLTAVFGCGGDRDAGKRPLMGAIAMRYSSQVVVTNDNPRSESPEKIARDITAGIDDPEKLRVIYDRKDAIEAAISNSTQGDCVLVAGKGHEQEQIIGAQVNKFDDRQVVQDILARCAA